MRLRTCNKRKARRTRASVAFDKSDTFCYILHEAPYVYQADVHFTLNADAHDLVMGMPKSGGSWRFISRRYCYDIKQQFPSYADAIVWLTKIKLSLMDKPEKYRLFSVAKVVEGYYDTRKREHVTRTTDLSNVSHSLPTLSERRSAKQRQLREQRYQQLRYAKTVARAAPKTKSTSTVWSTGTTTRSSTTQTMGGGWDVPIVSGSDWGTVSFSN